VSREVSRIEAPMDDLRQMKPCEKPGKTGIRKASETYLKGVGGLQIRHLI
jgi:hypothetical protein